MQCCWSPCISKSTYEIFEKIPELFLFKLRILLHGFGPLKPILNEFPRKITFPTHLGLLLFSETSEFTTYHNTPKIDCYSQRFHGDIWRLRGIYLVTHHNPPMKPHYRGHNPCLTIFIEQTSCFPIQIMPF